MITISTEKKARIDAFFDEWEQKDGLVGDTYTYLFDETIPLLNARLNNLDLGSGFHLLNDDPDEWDTFDQRI